MVEIERKFKVIKIPTNIKIYDTKLIKQGYIAIANDKSELRIRSISREYYITYKAGNGIKRQEIEHKISRSLFIELWKLTEGRRIFKKRMLTKFEKYKIEIDCFLDRELGFMIAEVEFPNVIEANAFIKPSWFNEEITYTQMYKNQNLAQ
ncbi:MAG: adenylate cyclase [Chitinophagales bacterium]|nr:adenylate cyclase [Chitinophagales bacterium]